MASVGCCDLNTSTTNGTNPAGVQNENEHEKATADDQDETIKVSPNSDTDDRYHDNLESPAAPLHSAKQQQCIQEEQEEKLKCILDKIHTGARSFFSVTLMADQFDVLSAPVSTAFLLEYLPRERIVSCFGSPYLKCLEDYLSSLHTISVMEYTVLIGRYLITGALLLGGVSPCCQHSGLSGAFQCHQQERDLEHVSHQLLQRFFDFFPLSLSSYIVKRVVDMRLAAATSTSTTTKHSSSTDGPPSQTQPTTFTCQLCQERIPACYRLVFTNSNNVQSNKVERETCCDCSFCEVCFWKDILENVDARIGDQDVVLCPCCDSTPLTSQPRQISDVENTTTKTVQMSPKELSEISKYKFDLLPVDSKALKGLGGKKRKKKIPEAEYLSESWAMAVVPSLGMCKSVRQDKLFTYTEKCALQYVHGCLETGVHINATNEYGQTPLYLAAWHGDLALVELLLEYGANPWISANGHLTLDGICRVYGHGKIHDRLQHFRNEYWPASTPTPTTVHSENHDLIPASIESLRVEDGAEPFLEVLIGLHRKHPGAGSFLIHNCIQSVSYLVRLWRGLPIDQTSSKTAKKAGACADRSYYCDTEGWISKSLQSRIVRAFCLDGLVNVRQKDVKVLPQMRFLNYQCIGSALAPHVDLCRVDRASGQRSTHSFLLYLTTCDTGGETALLEDLTGEKTLALVKPTTGHLLLFPHDCPHEGNVVQHVPKLLIRGEVILSVEEA